MTDKFAEYYQDRSEELSEYVHQNFKLIHTKMLSELRRKLDIEPDISNKDGYVSLMVSLYGRMFNEMVYGFAGLCQSSNVKITEIVPITTLQILVDLFEGKNPLNGRMRTDVKEDLEGFREYYIKNIDELRKAIDALPK